MDTLCCGKREDKREKKKERERKSGTANIVWLLLSPAFFPNSNYGVPTSVIMASELLFGCGFIRKD